MRILTALLLLLVISGCRGEETRRHRAQCRLIALDCAKSSPTDSGYWACVNLQGCDSTDLPLQ